MACCRNCFPEQRLSWGNGIIELGTFRRQALLRTMAAGYSGRALSRARSDRRASFCSDCTLLRPADELRNFARARRRSRARNFAGILSAICRRNYKTIRADRVLGWAVLGNTLFLVSRRAAAVHDRDLRPRCAARRRRAHQLPASRRRQSASALAVLPPDIFRAAKSNTG